MKTNEDDDVLYYRNLIDQFKEAFEGQDIDRFIDLTLKSRDQWGASAADLEKAFPERAELLDYVALVFDAMGKYEEVLSLYNRSLAIRRTVFGEDHPQIGISLDNLSRILELLGKTIEANESADRARVIFEAHFDRLNGALSLLIQEERYVDAYPIAAELVQLAIRVAGESSDLHAQSLNNLAFIYKQLNEYEKSEHYYKKALDIWKSVKNISNDPEYAMCLHNLGLLYQSRDEYSKAEPLLIQSVTILRASVGADEPNFLKILNLTARFLNSLDEDSSETRLIQAQEIHRRVELLVECLNNLARTHEKLGQSSEAESLYLTAMEMCRQLFDINHPATLATYEALLEFYKAHDNSEAFNRLIEEAGLSISRLARQAPFNLTFIQSLAPTFELLLDDLSISEPEAVQAIGEMTDDRFQQMLRDCIDDFIQQNYSNCFRKAIILNAVRPSLEVLQLYLLSIQSLAGAYFGKPTDLLYTIIDPLLHSISDDRWGLYITRLTLGQIDIDEVLADAENDAKRCQASFYAACRFLVEGKVAEAKRLLNAVLSFDVNILERRIAPEVNWTAPPKSAPDMHHQLTQLNSQVIEFMLTGHYDKALPIATEAYDLGLTEGLGLSDRSFRLSAYNLASLLYVSGDYSQSKNLYTNLVEFYRIEDIPDVAGRSAVLNGLGLVYTEQGQYRRAEELFIEAIEVVTKAGWPHDQNTSQAIGNLAELYRELKDYTKAIPLYEEVLSIQHAADERSAEYARWLNNYGILHLETGNIKSAAEFLKHAHELRLETLPKNHPDLASTLLSLADLESARDNIRAAKQYVKDALEIYKERFGPNHHKVVVTLNNLAWIHIREGELSEAEYLMRQAHETLKSSLDGIDPFLVATVQANLGLICAVTGRYEEALDYMESSASIEEETIWQIFAISSDRRRIEYLQYFYPLYYAVLSLSLKFSTQERFLRAAFNLVLKRKGIATEVWAIQRDELLTSKYPQLERKILDLNKMRQKITSKALKGPGIEGFSAHQRVLREWTVQKEQLEVEIGRQIPTIWSEQELRKVDYHSVAAFLPDDAALVEFVRLNVLEFENVLSSSTSTKPANPYYIAFVLLGKQPDKLRMIKLGDANRIDQMIDEFRSYITKGQEPSGSRQLRPAAEQRETRYGTTLGTVIFDPLVEVLKGYRRLFLAPDGDLTRLPFEALPAGDGRRLIDQYQISYLSVGRDLLRFEVVNTGQPTRPVVIADPDYDLWSSDTQSLVDETSSRGRLLFDLRRSGWQFRRLPGTHIEGEHIAALLEVQPMLEDKALESRLKALSSPFILHIATHGFFLPNQNYDPNGLYPGIGLSSDVAQNLFHGLSQSVDNPLLRSGLALAGVNTWLQEKPLPSEAEDGILTAEDVSGLDLTSTELVVLSACDTGLGDVQVGEGVFGLRRAFQVAGAKTLVMSLWQVRDIETQELMENFYQRLRSGEGRASALRKAQLAMKKKYPNVYYWGAFICQGDPGPLAL